MSVISHVQRFFAQTISGYGKIMREPDADWHMVAKRMMYDFRVFNSEDVNKENIEPSQGKSNVSSPMGKRNVSSPVGKSNVSSPLWELRSDFNASDFNVDDFNPDEFFESSPIKTGYEHNPDYNPEGEVESVNEEEVLKLKPNLKYKNTINMLDEKAMVDEDMFGLLKVWISLLA